MRGVSCQETTHAGGVRGQELANATLVGEQENLCATRVMVLGHMSVQRVAVQEEVEEM